MAGAAWVSSWRRTYLLLPTPRLRTLDWRLGAPDLEGCGPWYSGLFLHPALQGSGVQCLQGTFPRLQAAGRACQSGRQPQRVCTVHRRKSPRSQPGTGRPLFSQLEPNEIFSSHEPQLADRVAPVCPRLCFFEGDTFKGGKKKNQSERNLHFQTLRAELVGVGASLGPGIRPALPAFPRSWVPHQSLLEAAASHFPPVALPRTYHPQKPFFKRSRPLLQASPEAEAAGGRVRGRAVARGRSPAN